MDVFQNNKALSRFELSVGNEIAYADYARDEKILTIRYVFAPEALRGTGAAGRLMDHIVQAAHEQNLKIIPLCGYAASWLRKHKEHHDLLA
jgi:uncharacterized protein